MILEIESPIYFEYLKKLSGTILLRVCLLVLRGASWNKQYFWFSEPYGYNCDVNCIIFLSTGKAYWVVGPEPSWFGCLSLRTHWNARNTRELSGDFQTDKMLNFLTSVGDFLQIQSHARSTVYSHMQYNFGNSIIFYPWLSFSNSEHIIRLCWA